MQPMPCLVEGTGQKIGSIAQPAEHWLVLLPSDRGLSTASVFAMADRLGIGRSASELEEVSARLWAVASNGVSPLEYPGLLVNDLEPAAISLMPEIGEAKDRMADAGAPFVGMTGSGPTVFGLFPTEDEARAAAGRLGEQAIVCEGGRAP
jgi:4-diphosphocytidyl-2-C-methyl-D-erythritol kinase